jgi:hypothetical protein
MVYILLSELLVASSGELLVDASTGELLIDASNVR